MGTSSRMTRKLLTNPPSVPSTSTTAMPRNSNHRRGRQATQWTSLHGEDTTEEWTSRNRQRQGAPKEEPPKPGNHNKAEEPTGDTRQEQGSPKEELPKPGNQSKAKEPTSGTRQEQGAPEEELPKPGNHPKAKEPTRAHPPKAGSPQKGAAQARQPPQGQGADE